MYFVEASYSLKYLNVIVKTSLLKLLIILFMDAEVLDAYKFLFLKYFQIFSTLKKRNYSNHYISIKEISKKKRLSVSNL